MNHQSFHIWLTKEKNMQERSASDVVSRLNRATVMLGGKDINKDAVQLLNQVPNFCRCTMSIKSQLRRAVILYMEYYAKK